MNNNSQITPPASSKVLKFDVADAKTDRFICTMRMPVNPLLKLDLQQVLDFIFLKRPTLRHREIVIEF